MWSYLYIHKLWAIQNWTVGEAWQQGYLQCVLASYQTSSNGNRIVSGPISNAVWIPVCQQVDCCLSNVNCVPNKTVVWCSVTQACPCFTSYSWTPSSTRQMFDHPGTSLSKQDTTGFIFFVMAHTHAYTCTGSQGGSTDMG